VLAIALVVFNAIFMSVIFNSFVIFLVSGPENVMKLAHFNFCVPHDFLVETLFCFGCNICL
jgi:hypothetical protein